MKSITCFQRHISYECHNKYRLLPCTALTDWPFSWGGTVFCVSYEMKGNYNENNLVLWASILCRLHDYVAHATLLIRGGRVQLKCDGTR